MLQWFQISTFQIGTYDYHSNVSAMRNKIKHNVGTMQHRSRLHLLKKKDMNDYEEEAQRERIEIIICCLLYNEEQLGEPKKELERMSEIRIDMQLQNKELHNEREERTRQQNEHG